jgi:hypothetical protein
LGGLNGTSCSALPGALYFRLTFAFGDVLSYFVYNFYIHTSFDDAYQPLSLSLSSA